MRGLQQDYYMAPSTALNQLAPAGKEIVMSDEIFPENLPDDFVPYPESSPYNPHPAFGDRAAFRYRGLIYDVYEIWSLSTLPTQQLLELSVEEMSDEISRIKQSRLIGTLDCLPIPENELDTF